MPDDRHHGHDHGPVPAVPDDAPVLVEVTRGGMVESRHRGAVAVADAAGRLVLGIGDVAMPVYPRSSIKPIQALPLVESGAADALGLGDAELALACGSHHGTAAHVATVTAWLDRAGPGVAALECGPQVPASAEAARTLFAAGGAPAAVHNNCSGKHAGMIATAVHKGEAVKGYVRPEHPVQQRILGTYEQVCGLDLSAAPRGFDGCSVPVIAMPLGNLAAGMARLATPRSLPAARAQAARRLLAAMAARPEMVEGDGSFCTEGMRATGGKVLLKGGAEGMYVAVLPALGLGVALKIHDGAKRAAEVAMAAVLRRLGAFDAAATSRLTGWFAVGLANQAGRTIGEVRPAAVLGA
ncbi:MAG: asparaginase [Alphaproteobacteria bacterium]